MKHLLLSTLTCVILASRLFAAAPGPTQFFVASNGNDADPGTKEKPFATLVRAKEAVRARVAGGLKNNVRVVLRGNLIHDVHRSAYAHGGAPNNGFFIDEGSKGFRFESNVVHRTSGSSVRFNQCQREWHTWKGNAFDADATAAHLAAAAQRAGLEPAYNTLRPDLLEGRGK